jgi:hypothetical protein
MRTEVAPVILDHGEHEAHLFDEGLIVDTIDEAVQIMALGVFDDVFNEWFVDEGVARQFDDLLYLLTG